MIPMVEVICFSFKRCNSLFYIHSTPVLIEKLSTTEFSVCIYKSALIISVNSQDGKG